MNAFTFIASAILAGGIGMTATAQNNDNDSTEKHDPKQLTGKRFPLLVAENLEGDTVTLPSDTEGQVCVLTVAFEQDAQKQIDSWTKHILDNPKYTGICYYEIPMLKRIWKLMQGWIDGGMRSGIDPNRHKNVITYYGDLRKYKATLQITDTRYAYIYVLDADGQIRFVDQGYASDQGLEALHQTLAELLDNQE